MHIAYAFHGLFPIAMGREDGGELAPAQKPDFISHTGPLMDEADIPTGCLSRTDSKRRLSICLLLIVQCSVSSLLHLLVRHSTGDKGPLLTKDKAFEK